MILSTFYWALKAVLDALFYQCSDVSWGKCISNNPEQQRFFLKVLSERQGLIVFLNSNYLALLREKEMLIRKDHESTYSSSRTKF